MRRRCFLAGLLATGASALWAAEPNKVHRLALALLSSNPTFRMRFLDRLQQLGYIEGKNLIIDRYIVDGRSNYAEIARDIVRSTPDVIAVSLDNRFISQIAKEAYPIPVVALIPSIAAGLVHNVSHPEGNITGVTLDAGIEMQGKQLDILRQAVPSISRVAYLSNQDDWEGAWGRAMLDAGKALGISIVGVPLAPTAGEEEYRKAFETLAQRSAQALVFNGLPPNFQHRAFIAKPAAEYRLPSIGWALDVVEEGHGFLSYAPDYSGLPEQWVDVIDKVLRGSKVADIPVSQPTKFILAINLKTAKLLGLQVPPALVAQADKVVE
jgi:putative ABC transport system substrate-binding protein